MRILDTVVDLAAYVFVTIKDVILFIFEKISQIAALGLSKFMELNIFEKIFVLNSAPAMLCVVLPVARYHIFGTYFYINNPFSVYMIGIILAMWSSFIFLGMLKLLIRVLLNLYYLGWSIYLPLAGELTKAEPHVVLPWYYLNIIIPLVFIIFALLNYSLYRE